MTATQTFEPSSSAAQHSAESASAPPFKGKVALLTGGFDRPYAFGISTALASKGVALDVIGGKEVDSPEMHATAGLEFIDLHGDPRQAVSLPKKLLRIFLFYVKLAIYAAGSDAKVFHILWNNKVPVFDRTVLMLYYKLLGKKVVFTAHNVNAGRRDGNDSFLNRWSLKSQYRLCDGIFVHTISMKDELIREFGVRPDAITVIPFGINNAAPHTALTTAEARQQLGIAPGERAILFFGAIRPYKGLEHLVAAFQQVAGKSESYRLIIAGESKKDAVDYLRDIQSSITGDPSAGRVIQKIEFIPDEETEIYFKAADVLVLPYTLVFQSGVLFLAFSFGLPVIAADVGSFREDVIAGETGFLSPSCAPADLASTLETYFSSDLYRTLDRRRKGIRDFVVARNSWNAVASKTCDVYRSIVG